MSTPTGGNTVKGHRGSSLIAPRVLRWSVSSWSLHDALGGPWYEDTGGGGRRNSRGPEASGLSLIDLPAAAAGHGIGTLELCHFHFPSTDEAYLAELRAAIRDAGGDLFSVLIDTGDLTHSDPGVRARDLATIERWVDVAAAVGASGVRVAAGMSAVDVELSLAGLMRLAAYGKTRGVQVFTENWKAYDTAADELARILGDAEQRIGLCLDFGNAQGPDKAAVIQRLASLATSLHVKAERGGDGTVDERDLAACLRPVVEAGFTGPASLIADGWRGVTDLRERCQRLLAT